MSDKNKLFIHRINSKDEIIWVNDDWLEFARDNMDQKVEPEKITGKPILSYFSNPETKHIYKALIDKVREEQVSKEFSYRCDSPECRRYMKMTIKPLPQSELEFRNEITKLEPRESVKLLETGVKRSDEFLTMCSWCKRIRLGNENWVEVEKAVEILNLFEKEALPKLTHGICEECKNKFF